jgi:hypothetical protein
MHLPQGRDPGVSENAGWELGGKAAVWHHGLAFRRWFDGAPGIWRAEGGTSMLRCGTLHQLVQMRELSSQMRDFSSTGGWVLAQPGLTGHTILEYFAVSSGDGETVNR